jgi:hypothetical protein
LLRFHRKHNLNCDASGWHSSQKIQGATEDGCQEEFDRAAGGC